ANTAPPRLPAVDGGAVAGAATPVWEVVAMVATWPRAANASAAVASASATVPATAAVSAALAGSLDRPGGTVPTLSTAGAGVATAAPSGTAAAACAGGAGAATVAPAMPATDSGSDTALIAAS